MHASVGTENERRGREATHHWRGIQVFVNELRRATLTHEAFVTNARCLREAQQKNEAWCENKIEENRERKAKGRTIFAIDVCIHRPCLVDLLLQLAQLILVCFFSV